jgi:FkbM family methyltransferase
MLVPLIAAFTRRLQTLQPHRPIRGLTRFASLLDRWLPAYQGNVQLPDGTYLALDSRHAAERWLMYAGDYQPALTAVLKQRTRPGYFCLDIGANLGFYTIKFGRWVLPGGRVAAFEANPVLAGRIAHNADLNRFSHVSVIDRAVHNQPGPLTFYVASSPGKSSIDSRRVSDPAQQITVQAITVDEFMAESGWQRLDVIKLDIEGNDCNALLGAQRALKRFQPFIVFEYWYNTPPATAEAAFSLLTNLGYKLHVLVPDGQQSLFDWRALHSGHCDVICDPTR